MAITYTTIDKMTNLTSLYPTDKILVARSDTAGGYATYSSTFELLSSAISCDISEQTFSNIIVTSFAEAQCNNKVPSYALLLSVYEPVKYISAHYLDIDTASKTINGSVSFANTPTIPDITVGSGDSKLAVNQNVLSSYVTNAIKTRSIGNYAPTSRTYKVQTTKANTYEEYNEQDRTNIVLLKKDIENKPIIHRCMSDCTVVITGKVSSPTFNVFGFTSTDTDKQTICTKQEDYNWHLLGRVGNGLTSAQVNNALHIAAKQGTILCFYLDDKWDTDDLKYVPEYSTSFKVNDIIRVDEYNQ